MGGSKRGEVESVGGDVCMCVLVRLSQREKKDRTAAQKKINSK